MTVGLQLAAARHPDVPPRPAGDAGLHADALRHVLQRVDLPGRRPRLRPRLLRRLPSAGPDVSVRPGPALNRR